MSLEYFEKIDDVTPIALFFNRTMDNLAVLRKLCAPVSLIQETKAEKDFKNKTFCNMCRYECWMHQVIGRLCKWKIIVEEYFSEDFDDSVINILQDSVNIKDDIVSETLPYDIWELCLDLISQSHIGVIDSLKVIYGSEVETYKVTENGTTEPMTREDIDLINIERQVDADDDSKRLMAIAGGISFIVQTIRSFSELNIKEEEIMIVIHNMTDSLLNMDFKRAEKVLKEWEKKL